MASEITRDEFVRLEARVSVVEHEVDGEKLVSRHILEQTRRNGDDLAALRTRLDRVERKVDSLERSLNGLTTALPGIVGEAVREAFRERDRKG